MPIIRLSGNTRDLVLTQVLPGFTFACLAIKRDDGWFEVPVDDKVAMRIAVARSPGESDNDVVSRLGRAALGSPSGQEPEWPVPSVPCQP